MPLPAPLLDDRRFQDIVDQAKILIPQYCPEWTDHNVSDPGVTLIELFAWMTDMLLYRVNQVPTRNYIKFLDLLGVKLEEPRAAIAPVTFYLSAAQPDDITLPANTEVATVHTESSPATIFSTEKSLTIRPPTLIDAFTRNVSRGNKAPWTRHNLKEAELRGQPIHIFPEKPSPGDAFVLALEKDHSLHILELNVVCDPAGGAGVNPTSPPLQWQAWQGEIARWVPCEVEYDSTGGFNNKVGRIVLHVPAMMQGTFQGLEAYWLRCLHTETQASTGTYEVSPVLLQLRVTSWGATVDARHCITVFDEVLGTSDGTPGQTFQLRHTPILALDPALDYLIVQPPAGGELERWQEVADFADSRAQDRYFMLDKLDGTVTLGPSLRQPDGSIYRFGAVPDKGCTLSISRYRYGGGVEGNVAQNTLTVLKSSIPYVTRVSNRTAAVGGRDAQSLEDAMLRVPQKLRTRNRAVTADDYEVLASQVPGVARAHCLAPLSQPAVAPPEAQPEEVSYNEPRPGQVFVVILPQADKPWGYIPTEQLVLSAELQAAVVAYLGTRCVLGTLLEVRQPQFLWVSVRAVLNITDPRNPVQVRAVQQSAEAALYDYLNPYVGGPHGNGWPFGRGLNQSEIYGLLQRIEHVEFVGNIQMSVREQQGAALPKAAQPVESVTLPRYALICSDQHEVKVV
jgi:predicted phage baseplate assembly protein